MPLREGAWRMPPARRGCQAPWLWKIGSQLTVTAVAFTTKFWMGWLNRTVVHNKETLVDAVDNRPTDQGLLTVSNHTSCIDDPCLWSVLKMKQILNLKKIRHVSAAADVAFSRDIYAVCCSLGRVFPVVRGDGVYQRGMDFAIEHLDLGNWCHHFPEGKIIGPNEDFRFKWGVGRIIADCQKAPLVLPIWHIGMDKVLPTRSPYIPQIRKQVTFLIGNPMDFAPDVELLRSLKKSPREIRKHITEKIQTEMKQLKVLAEELHKDLNR